MKGRSWFVLTALHPSRVESRLRWRARRSRDRRGSTGLAAASKAPGASPWARRCGRRAAGALARGSIVSRCAQSRAHQIGDRRTAGNQHPCTVLPAQIGDDSMPIRGVRRLVPWKRGQGRVRGQRSGYQNAQSQPMTHRDWQLESPVPRRPTTSREAFSGPSTFRAWSGG